MALKFIIFFAILAIALGFTLPEGEQHAGPNYELENLEEQLPAEEVVLVRQARSPNRRFEANGRHHPRYGSSASLSYTHPLGNNFEAYGGVSRNFKYNDNSGHVGFRYKF